METDPILTAWALNELPLDQQSAVEEALLHDPRMRGEAAAVQGFCRFLSSQLQDSETALTEAQRGYITRAADPLRPLRYTGDEPAVIVRQASKKSRGAAWWRENHEVVVPLAAAAVLVLASLWFVYHDRNMTEPARTAKAATGAAPAASPAPPPAPMLAASSGGSGSASMVATGGTSPRFSSSLNSSSHDRSAGDWSRQAISRGSRNSPSGSSSEGRAWGAVPAGFQSSSQDSFTILSRANDGRMGRAVARIEITHTLPQVVAGRKMSELDAAASLGKDVSAAAGLREAPVPSRADSPLASLASLDGTSLPSPRLAELVSAGGQVAHGNSAPADPTWSPEVRDLVAIPEANPARHAAREALLDRNAAPEERVAAFPVGGVWTDARQQRACQVPLPLGRGSFATLRRRLGTGQRPLPEEIRIEEWINAFEFEETDAAGAAGDHPLALRHETADSPWQKGSRLARLVITGARARTTAEVRGVTLEFDPMRVRAYRIVGFENRGKTFPLGLPASEVARQTSLAILAEFVPATTGDTSSVPLVATVRYDLPDGRQGVFDTPVKDSGAALASASADMRFTTAVAAFGLLLQAPPAREVAATLLQIRALARESLGEDRDGRRGEFLLMMDRARAMLERSSL